LLADQVDDEVDILDFLLQRTAKSPEIDGGQVGSDLAPELEGVGK
jgi:hypothetical protein